MTQRNMEPTVIASGILQWDSAKCQEVIEYQGVTYHRFMDQFYLDRPSIDLTLEQVYALCRARSVQPALIENGPGNNKVKQKIMSFIEAKNPNTLLEFGAGDHPTLKNAKEEYKISDGDKAVVNRHLQAGINCIHFDNSSGLSFPDNHFDLIFAVFVFHFKIYPTQISELSRCIKEDGVIIANVYLITEDAREDIVNNFKSAGFASKRVYDETECCKGNEYWILSLSKESLELNEALLRAIP